MQLMTTSLLKHVPYQWGSNGAFRAKSGRLTIYKVVNGRGLALHRSRIDRGLPLSFRSSMQVFGHLQMSLRRHLDP
ncbi:hypothetical protein BHE74_00019058 [Ensete ventricosum]|nr:hypothetical protein BHE74_00019058 [Ensete ventricosum]